MTRIAVVVPAAGRGTRLGIDVPKIFAPLGGSRTVWTVLRDRSLDVADHIHVVLSPQALPLFERDASAELAAGRASFSVQHEPLGMGDAIFRGRDRWGDYDHIIVMWGDQVGVSNATLKRVASALRAAARPTLVLPLVAMRTPYVQYLLDEGGRDEGAAAPGVSPTRLLRVLQSREGDACTPGGLADVGVFGLGVPGLVQAWNAYSALGVRGKKTGEANFLPFLPYLSTTLGWPLVAVDVHDPEEARGINTPEDLAYFRIRFAGARAGQTQGES